MNAQPENLTTMLAWAWRQRLVFEEQDWVFCELVTADELRVAYRFRYEICVEQLHWVEGDAASRLESDQYDEYSYHFGCYEAGRLVGYMRMTPESSPVGIMSRNHFEHLWRDDPGYPAQETADISRLILRSEYVRQPRRRGRVLLGLYRLAYGRAQLAEPRIRYWYFITSRKLMMALRWRLLLPVRTIGHGATSDGKVTYAVALDLRHGRRRLRLLAPLRWRRFERAKRLERPWQD